MPKLCQGLDQSASLLKGKCNPEQVFSESNTPGQDRSPGEELAPPAGLQRWESCGGRLGPEGWSCCCRNAISTIKKMSRPVYGYPRLNLQQSPLCFKSRLVGCRMNSPHVLLSRFNLFWTVTVASSITRSLVWFLSVGDMQECLAGESTHADVCVYPQGHVLCSQAGRRGWRSAPCFWECLQQSYRQ